MFGNRTLSSLCVFNLLLCGKYEGVQVVLNYPESQMMLSQRIWGKLERSHRVFQNIKSPAVSEMTPSKLVGILC